MLAGWINRHQQAVLTYQREEIRALREMLGGKRLRFTDGQRRRLALKAQVLTRSALKNLGPLVTPDTLCRWFRKHAGGKYDPFINKSDLLSEAAVLSFKPDSGIDAVGGHAAGGSIGCNPRS